MSEAYLTQIQELVRLQKVDDEIFEVKQQAASAPLYVEELEKRFNEAQARMNHVQDKIDHLEDQRKRLANEVEEDAARLKKSRNKLMQVGNDRDYQLMQREVDSMEKMSRTHDEERLAVMEELNIQNEAKAEIGREYHEINSELEEKRDSLAKTLADCGEKLCELEKKRNEASQFITPQVFQRYEFIRKRLEHPVIVEVEERICSGCNIAIPPQTFIELQTGQQILNCPNCQRLIYWSHQMPGYEERHAKKQPELVDAAGGDELEKTEEIEILDGETGETPLQEFE